MTVKAKFNRCVEFTLADGSTINVKVMGDKAQAKADALKLIAAFTPVADMSDPRQTLDDVAAGMADAVSDLLKGRK
jgi:hypothetical protein